MHFLSEKRRPFPFRDKKTFFSKIPLTRRERSAIMIRPLGVFFYEKAFRKEGEYAPFRAINSEDMMRERITLACSECKQRNYDTMKNKKNTPDRLEMNKYCPFCRKHTKHKETK